MEKNIYINTILKRRVILKAEYINKNFDKNIEDLLKYEVGDKCIKEGYVKLDSINIIKRSTAKIISSNFSGDLAIDIVYSAEICNPVRGNIIECTISRINKLGIQAENPPLSIIIAKQYHDNKDLFKNLKVGDKIDVMVIGKRYYLNDKIIEVVGKLAADISNKKLKIKKEDTKKKEMTNIFQNKLEEDEGVGELESVDEEGEEEEEEVEEEEDVSDMEKDVLEDEGDEDDDMLEEDIEEEEEEEEDTEDFE